MAPAVADELEIARLLTRLAMAADDRDFAAYRACLFDWVDTALPGELAELARGDDYARKALARLAAVDWTHHRPGLPLLIAGKTPNRLSGLADFAVRIGWTDGQGHGRTATAGGRYHFAFIRKDGRWLICGRATAWRYREGNLMPESD